MTRTTLDPQLRIARDERVQARLATTYEDLLEMVGWVMEIVDATQPILEGDWGPGPLGKMSARLAGWLMGPGSGPPGARPR